MFSVTENVKGHVRACKAWGLGFLLVCLDVLVFAGFFFGEEVGVGFFQFVI